MSSRPHRVFGAFAGLLLAVHRTRPQAPEPEPAAAGDEGHVSTISKKNAFERNTE